MRRSKEMFIIKRMPGSRRILIISFALYVILTLPLVVFLIIDGTIQQQIYMHAASHFGRHEIAFIGDSITAGGFVWANEIGVYNLNIWNYGKGGFKTEQIAYYAARVARDRFRFCFVMSGRNDAITDDESALKSYKDYIAILQILKNAKVEPVVTLMLYRENEKFSKYIDEYNNRVRAYCISNNITVIDLNSLLCDESGLRKDYTMDGVHLKHNAYNIWGREINRVLHEKKYL